MGKRDAEHARSDIDRYRKQLGITCLRVVIVCYQKAPAVANERLVLDLPIDLQFKITVNSVYANRPPVYGSFLSLFFEYGSYKSKLTVFSISRRVHLTLTVLYRMVYCNIYSQMTL